MIHKSIYSNAFFELSTDRGVVIKYNKVLSLQDILTEE